MVCVQVMGFSPLQTRGAKGVLLALTGGINDLLPLLNSVAGQDVGVGLFPKVMSDRTRGKSLKLHQGSLV